MLTLHFLSKFFGRKKRPEHKSKAEFTAIYFKKLCDKFPNANFTIKEDLSITSVLNEEKRFIYLDNAYNEYSLYPEEIEDIITRYLEASIQLHTEEKKEGIDVSKIIPIIKPLSYLDNLRALSREAGTEKEPWIVYEVYNEDLLIVYAEDQPKSIAYFHQEDFDKLGIDKADLLPLALKNLQAILPEIKIQEGEGLDMITCGGDFESSLILVESIWTGGNFQVDGPLIIAIPNKDLLFVTGSNQVHAIKKIKEIIGDSYYNYNHPISTYLYKWTGKKFERYLEPTINN